MKFFYDKNIAFLRDLTSIVSIISLRFVSLYHVKIHIVKVAIPHLDNSDLSTYYIEIIQNQTKPFI